MNWKSRKKVAITQLLPWWQGHVLLASHGLPVSLGACVSSKTALQSKTAGQDKGKGEIISNNLASVSSSLYLFGHLTIYNIIASSGLIYIELGFISTRVLFIQFP